MSSIVKKLQKYEIHEITADTKAGRNLNYEQLQNLKSNGDDYLLKIDLNNKDTLELLDKVTLHSSRDRPALYVTISPKKDSAAQLILRYDSVDDVWWLNHIISEYLDIDAASHAITNLSNESEINYRGIQIIYLPDEISKLRRKNKN